MQTATINTNDIIDVRDIFERIEELENDIQEWGDQNYNNDGLTHNEVSEELDFLLSILADLKSNGGDEQWRGDWYPVTLIRDTYFFDYAQELADDIGAVPRDAQWPLTCIDWEQAARELRMDYSATDIEGVTYWYR